MDEYRYLTELTERYPVLKQVEGDIRALYETVRDSYENGGKLLIAGNGGSCADSEHIVGELMKGFVKKRSVPEEMAESLKAVDPERGEKLACSLQQGLAAIALTGHIALSTAFLNDVDGEVIYAQQVYGYGKPGDVLLGITTSGNSENIMYAAVAAKAKGMKVVGLTGRDGGKLKGICDAAVVVPETETFKIQELHLPVYHALCLMLEEHFFR
ncbi:SIS domain-containing protein [uncultured Clostridium sp.]|uniref:D-sedoheptulose-7-phosphate isomerase n=1 Tax=uncultured Clostridium sp. TaxID=59620 RepID=UPI0025F8796D|nr:SIS domain-containing protein [uncultured Clostridium sp.]